MKELHRELLFEQGDLKRYRIYRQGHSHYEGKNIQGWTGNENVIERTSLVIPEGRIFYVNGKNKTGN